MTEQPQERRARALIEAGMVIASELSLPAVLQKIIDLACDVADARYGALGVLGGGNRLTDFITHGVTDEERRAIGTLPEGHGILGVLIHDAHPLRLDRIADDPRSVGFPPHHPPMTSFLGVPITIRGKVFGNLYLTEKRGASHFDGTDEEAIVTLAAQAAVAIENARLVDETLYQQRRLAVLEDRERIAKELHDGVIQSLYAVGMLLQATEAVAADPEVQGRLATAVNDIDGAIRALRDYIFGLSPGGPADQQLALTLEDLANGFRAGSKARIETDIDPAVTALLAGRAPQLVQIAREALSNAVRHGGASVIRLRVGSEGSDRVMEIGDDGVGFATEDPAAGHGLRNLQHRATEIGAALEIRTAAGEGTRVRIIVAPDGERRA